MSEYISIDKDRVVKIDDSVSVEVAAIGEFLSVAFHAVRRLERYISNANRRIGIWGDGSLGYTVASVLRYKYPEVEIVVFGKNPLKLSCFSFVDRAVLVDDLEDNFMVDNAFECTGGDASADAIDSIIDHINPQGTVMLMGVSEQKVPVYTRDILEKGLSFIGSSRSAKIDFIETAKYLELPKIQRRFSTIISDIVSVDSIAKMYESFNLDKTNAFKTVIRWNI